MVLEHSTHTPRKRKQVKRACTTCRAAKTGCSESRPCKRCVSMKMGHLCSDAPVKKKEDAVCQSSSRSFDSITPLFATNIPPILASPVVTQVVPFGEYAVPQGQGHVEGSISGLGHLSGDHIQQSQGVQTQSFFSQSPMPLFPLLPVTNSSSSASQGHMQYHTAHSGYHATSPAPQSQSYMAPPASPSDFQSHWQF